MHSPTQYIWRWVLLAALLLATIVIPFAIWGESLERWVETAKLATLDPGLAATAGALLLAADVVLPIPSSLVAIVLGTVLGPWLGTLVVTAGLTASCIIGYAIGWTIGNAATRHIVGADESQRATAWLDRYGVFALLICRPVPVLAEASIITAGALRLLPAPVFIATTFANIGISAVYATIGASAGADLRSFLLAFALAIAVLGSVLLLFKLIERRWRHHSAPPNQTG